MGRDGMDGGFKRPRNVGESAGFRREGLPNVIQANKDETDEPKAFEVLAADIARGAEGTIIERQGEWKVTRAEIDENKKEFLDRGRTKGLKVLEDDLEAEMRNVENEKESVLRRLGLSLAYLELTKDLNEDHLDRPTEA